MVLFVARTVVCHKFFRFHLPWGTASLGLGQVYSDYSLQLSLKIPTTSSFEPLDFQAIAHFDQNPDEPMRSRPGRR